MELRESRPLPAELDSPETLESFLLALASKLAPLLEVSLVPYDWRSGERSGTSFSLEGRLADGTLVIVTAVPLRSTIELLIDDAAALKTASSFVGRWTYLGFGGVLSVGFAAGTWAESALWGTVVSVSVLVGWVALDVYFQRRKLRLSRPQPLVEQWRQRFDEAVAEAARRMVRSTPPP